MVEELLVAFQFGSGIAVDDFLRLVDRFPTAIEVGG